MTRPPRAWTALAACAAWTAAALPAAAGPADSARSPAPAEAPPSAPAPGPPPAPSPKRDVPDYDGRGRKPDDAGDMLLWVPRVVLSPLYLVSEFGLRRPLGAAMSAAERAELPRKIYDFFTFGPDHKAGFAPVGFVEFGFNPSVGIYAFWDDAGFSGNHLRLHVEAWPTDWVGGSITDRIDLGGGDSLALRVSGVRRPDHVFYGIGPRTLQSDQSRYGEDRVDERAALELHPTAEVTVRTTMGLHAIHDYDGHFGEDPSVQQRAAQGAFPVPYGLGRAFAVETNGVAMAFDTRRPWPQPRSGVRLEIQAEQGSDIAVQPPSSFIRYGASAGVYYDVNGHQRVLSLTVAALFVDPLGDGPIPFTELVSLGGDGPMRGFFPGRLVDRSAAVAAARYRWPVGPWIDGTILLAAGNVFGEHLEAFEPGLIRLSGALGLSGRWSEDYPLELLVGAGTETFEHGADVDSIRISLGVSRGF